MRKLPEYSQFNIEVTASKYENGYHATFKDTSGQYLPDYKSKLTPSQWQKASVYLNRTLIPFCGYSYTVKPEYLKEAVYKIR
jgi:hypothetical protein